MITFFIFQISMIVFAVASAFEEAAFTFPFRVLAEEQFPWFQKEKLLKTAHRSGGFAVFVLLIAFGGIQTVDHGFVSGGMTAAACGFWYWLLFDIVFALKINQKWSYLGNTAGSDKGLGKYLGKNAGQIKAVFCVVALITINLTYKIF